MNSSLFVAGFPYETDQEELAGLFRTCGTVRSVKILVERETGRSRGIGFVEMSSGVEARAALAKLNGAALGGRKIFVSEARPQERGPSASVGKPGFVERRSGKDRRQAGGNPGGGDARRGEPPAARDDRRNASFNQKGSWAGKPDFPGKKKWAKGPSSGGDKREGPGSRKKWGPGGPGGANKWGGKPKRFGGGFRGRGGR